MGSCSLFRLALNVNFSLLGAGIMGIKHHCSF